MTDIIFPALEQRFKFQKRIVYATFLTDVVRGSTDAIDALLLFRGLLYGEQKGPESVGYMAFDPHGGETGCHLRAGMVLEVFRVHRELAFDNGQPIAPAWIDKSIEALRETSDKAKKLCARLTKDRVAASKLGLSDKEDTPTRILEIVRWKEPVFDKGSGGLYESPSQPSTHEPGSISSSKLTKALESLNVQQGNPKAMDHDATSSSATAPQTPSSTATSFDDSLSPVRTRWDLHDSQIMLRFVVYAYVLSKYKIFYCLKSNVGARLFPEGATKYQYELMADYWNYDNVEFRKAKLDRIGSELRVLQSWMSDLTCAWLQSCALRYPLSGPMTSLAKSTVQKSSKALAALPCYPAYLLLRHELGKHHETYVIIDRHFCPHGIHFNVFLAELENNPDCTPAKPVHPCKWTLHKASIPELYTHPNQSQAHPVVMGNSIHGPVTEYMARLASHYTAEPIATTLHAEDACTENTAHVQDFLESDQDRVAQSFFGAHVSYSFPLLDGQDENTFVSSRIKEELPALQEEWITSRKEIAEVGAGHESLEIFGWQHMFVETKERLAFKLEEWIRRKDLMPLSADVGVC